MRVVLLDKEKNELIDAKIVSAKLSDMKSIADGWEFSWHKHFNLPNTKAFKIVRTSEPDSIEGLMIFQMVDRITPFMAYLESAPHNKGKEKKFDYVAGCLIARACQLSTTEGKDYHKGYLSFYCMNEKVVKNYHDKYGAIRVDKTLMYIEPKTGNGLVETYLLREK